MPGVRLARVARQLSQEQLAAAAGVTRQAVAGVEAGRFAPSLPVALRLARALGRTVEELFGESVPPATVAGRLAEPFGGSPAGGGAGRRYAGRAELGVVAGRRVAFPLDGPAAGALGFRPAAGLAAPGPAGTEVEVRLLRPEQPAVVVAGCDPALPLLAGPLARLDVPVGLLWWPCSTARALALAAVGAVHAAGIHRPADRPARLPAAAGAVAGGVVVIGFAAWQEGLAIAPGLADRVRSVGDVARLGVPVANREPGAEARALLQRQCRRHGIRPASLPGWETVLPGHLSVAAAVAAGLAGAGVTTGPAAAAHQLPFVPLADERFDLVVPRRLLGSPEVGALLDALGTAELRDQLGSLTGYRTDQCGQVVAEPLG